MIENFIQVLGYEENEIIEAINIVGGYYKWIFKLFKLLILDNIWFNQSINEIKIFDKMYKSDMSIDNNDMK